MADYKFPLKDRFEVAEGTMAFVFDTSALAGGPNFSFRAGQYIEAGLENPLYTDEKKDHRDFSIASSPNDKGILMVATRMTGSALKRSLVGVPLGTAAKIEGPYGDFTLHQNTARPAIFIAGGIGITPCRSIIKYATEEKLPHKITLIYSNRNPEGAAFLADLQKWESDNSNFKLLATMTQMNTSKKTWSGLTGYVDKDFIRNNVPDISSAVFYVVGPPAMVAGVTKTLEELKISRDDMRFEEFSGY